ASGRTTRRTWCWQRWTDFAGSRRGSSSRGSAGCRPRRWGVEMSMLQIRQIRSGIGAPQDQRATLKALGLRHQRTVVQKDNPAIRGMIFKVRHLVEVTEVEGQE